MIQSVSTPLGKDCFNAQSCTESPQEHQVFHRMFYYTWSPQTEQLWTASLRGRLLCGDGRKEQHVMGCRLTHTPYIMCVLHQSKRILFLTVWKSSRCLKTPNGLSCVHVGRGFCLAQISDDQLGPRVLMIRCDFLFSTQINEGKMSLWKWGISLQHKLCVLCFLNVLYIL